MWKPRPPACTGGRLFRHFRRDPDAEDRRNSLLNYAYALLRACVARELAARGFAPALGIHHRGPYNAFNLADDMMEAWRPFADLLVARHLEAGPAGDDAELAPADKAALLGLPHGCVRLLQVTEKQYGRMRLLVGDMPVMEKEAATQLLLF